MPSSWSGRLGDGTGMPDSLAGSGVYVHDISDYKEPFQMVLERIRKPWRKS